MPPGDFAEVSLGGSIARVKTGIVWHTQTCK